MVQKRKNIYLIGMMGSGKSSAGKLAASEMSMNFIDSDQSIEKIAQKSVSEIFASEGEQSFREMEREFIQCGHPPNNSIISCGGGLCMNKGVFDKMRSKGTIICLWAEPKTIYDRVKNDNSRPLLQVNNPILQIKNIFHERSGIYQKADFVIKTDDLQVEEVADRIIETAYLK